MSEMLTLLPASGGSPSEAIFPAAVKCALVSVLTAHGYDLVFGQETIAMQPPGLSDINAFLAVAEYGSFAKAAVHLGISPPTLTRIIRLLEKNLAVRLFNRTTRKVSLTDAGKYLVEHLRPVLKDYASVLESLNSFRDRPAGSLRILTWPALAKHFLTPMLSEFATGYPDITIEINTNWGVEDIVSGNYDAGIQSGPYIDNDMITVRICEDLPTTIVASPAYLARHPRPSSPDDLNDHNCIRIRFPTGALGRWPMKKSGRVTEVEVGGTLIVGEVSMAIDAAVDGLGLAWLATDFAAPLIAEGKLVSLLEECCMPVDGFYLCYPNRQYMTAQLQALIDFFQKKRKARRRKPA